LEPRAHQDKIILSADDANKRDAERSGKSRYSNAISTLNGR